MLSGQKPQNFGNFIEFRLFIFTSLISASPITQGHFLYGNYQHLSTPVWLTIGLSVYLAAFVYERGDLSFPTTSSCLLGNSRTDCFWLTRPPHPVVLISIVHSLFSRSVQFQELLGLPSRGAAFA